MVKHQKKEQLCYKEECHRWQTITIIIKTKMQIWEINLWDSVRTLISSSSCLQYLITPHIYMLMSDIRFRVIFSRKNCNDAEFLQMIFARDWTIRLHTNICNHRIQRAFWSHYSALTSSILILKCFTAFWEPTQNTLESIQPNNQ